MRSIKQRWCIVPVTVGLLLTCVASTSANRLSYNKQKFKVTWTPLTIGAGSNTVRCNLTIKGSFHSRTIAKVVDALVGHISAYTMSNCVGGGGTVLTSTLPWHRTYEGFAGTLPIVISDTFSIIGLGISVQPSGSVACLARTTQENPAVFIEQISSGRITGARADETAEIPLEGFLCAFAGEGHFSGTGTVTEDEGPGSLTITLI